MEQLDRKIIEAYQNGMKVAEICRQLGTHTQKIYKVLRENGISKKGGKFTPETISQILELARQDISPLVIAEQFYCSPGAVHRIMRENGLKLQVGRPWRREKSSSASPLQPSEAAAGNDLPEDLRALVMAPENRIYTACFRKERKEVKSAAEALNFMYSVLSRRFTLSSEDVAAIEDTFRQLQEFDKPRQALVCPLSIRENLRFKLSLVPEVAEVYFPYLKSRDMENLEAKKADWSEIRQGKYSVTVSVGVYSDKGDAVKYYDVKGAVMAESKEEAYNKILEKIKAETGEERFNSLKVPGKYSDKVKFVVEPMG